MNKFLVELIIAIREIKEILTLHGEEIEELKNKLECSNGSKEEKVDEKLIELALHGSRGTYSKVTEKRIDERMKELEIAIRDLSEKLDSKENKKEVEVSGETLNKLKRAIAE